MNTIKNLPLITVRENFCFFWHQWCPFSLDHQLAPFEVKGLVFESLRQYLVFAKAKIYNSPLAEQVIVTSDPAQLETLSNNIKIPDQSDWQQRMISLVTTGLRFKLQQHAALSLALADTRNLNIAYASEEDNFWGIGLKPMDHRALNKAEWVGKNHLGNILMYLRSNH